ncbi:MAG: DUF1080 domain-containing protein [Planctomycetaceae bacterium]|jgi:hypothetical protein|nr:DUF1080 domain-containing protein [Planctomycetaceae bacterium]
MKRVCIALLSIAALTLTAAAASAQLTDEQKNDGWISIFDGKTLTGWKSNEKYEGFEIKDGAIVGKGNRNHLYYMEELQNFELKLDVKISKGGNSGVYVKSQWQDENWPVTGFELQVNSSHSDPVKTGSLYNIIKLFKAPHGDDEWFTYHLICKGRTLEVRVDGELLYIYDDPVEKAAPVSEKITEQNKRISQKGYIALQQHDPKSIPQFKNIYLKKL